MLSSGRVKTFIKGNTQIYIQSLSDEKRLKSPAEELIDSMFWKATSVINT